jgi:hypothetical protein
MDAIITAYDGKVQMIASSSVRVHQQAAAQKKSRLETLTSPPVTTAAHGRVDLAVADHDHGFYCRLGLDDNNLELPIFPLCSPPQSRKTLVSNLDN